MKIYTNEEISKKIQNKNTRKKIINWILYPIVTVLLVCSIILIVQIIKKPGTTPNLFGFKAYSVASGSMEPTLLIGDVVIIKEVEEDEIKNNQIITFSEEKTVITHRIVDVVSIEGKKLYQTKGDNNNAVDENLVRFENIEGRYICKIPKLGKIINYIRDTKFIIIILIILYILYAILQEKDNRKNARHQKRKELEKK